MMLQYNITNPRPCPALTPGVGCRGAGPPIQSQLSAGITDRVNLIQLPGSANHSAAPNGPAGSRPMRGGAAVAVWLCCLNVALLCINCCSSAGPGGQCAEHSQPGQSDN